jgi:hypothetical protein
VGGASPHTPRSLYIYGGAGRKNVEFCQAEGVELGLFLEFGVCEYASDYGTVGLGCVTVPRLGLFREQNACRTVLGLVTQPSYSYRELE